MNQAEIVNKQSPADRDESGSKIKPAPRLAKLSEQDRLDQSARDVEKIVSKLERPSNHGDDVQDRARPENENDEQAGDDIKPENKLALGNHGMRVLD